MISICLERDTLRHGVEMINLFSSQIRERSGTTGETKEEKDFEVPKRYETMKLKKSLKKGEILKSFHFLPFGAQNLIFVNEKLFV